MVRCGAWAWDELRRLCKMAKAPPTKAEWSSFFARFNRLIALHREADSEAGVFVRHLGKAFDALFTFLLENGVDPTNNFAERMLRYAVLYPIFRMLNHGRSLVSNRRGTI